MRLPAIRPQHRRDEDAREFNERLWFHYQGQLGPLFVEATDRGCVADAKAFSDSRHRFWLSRDFALRCRRAPDKSGFFVWLEPKTAKQEAAA